jgi:hypothetical protein
MGPARSASWKAPQRKALAVMCRGDASDSLERTVNACRVGLEDRAGTRADILRRCQSKKAWSKQLRMPTLQHQRFARLMNSERFVRSICANTSSNEENAVTVLAK